VAIALTALAAAGLILAFAGGAGGSGADPNPNGLAAQQSPPIAPAGKYYYLDELSVQRGLSGSYTL
jgi:hypothetical protein